MVICQYTSFFGHLLLRYMECPVVADQSCKLLFQSVTPLAGFPRSYVHIQVWQWVHNGVFILLLRTPL